MERLRPGAVFAGHRIEAIVGAGGMGVVYRAVHVALERTVALKVIAPERAADPAFRERFRRESRLAAALDHPNVVTVFDSGEQDGLPYVTMRLVDGPDLGRRVRAAGPLDPADAVDVVAQVASALDAAHGRGLVHRDVKPANVLLDPPRAFLGDFGLARPLDATGGPTATAEWVGTVEYAAPEQISEARAEPRSDVYALAGVLHTALTGRVPFPRDDAAAVMWAHVHEEPPRLQTLDHPALEEVVRRGMAKDPADRFARAGELAQAARDALAERATAVAGGPATVSTDAVAARTGRRPGRRRTVAAVAAAVVAAALAAVALLVVLPGGGDGGDALGARVTVETVGLPGEPVGVAASGGAAWVAVEPPDSGGAGPEGLLVGIEGAAAAEPIALPGRPRAVAAADGVVWVLVARPLGSGLQRVEPREGRLVGGPVDVDVSGGDAELAVAGDAVWVSDPLRDRVVRFDAEASRVTAEVDVPAGVAGPLAVADGTVWVVGGDPADDVLSATPVEAASGAAGQAVRVGGFDSGAAIAPAGADVWVGDGDADAVRRIDGAQRRLGGEALALEGGAAALAAGAGAVWALDGERRAVARIDPDAGAFRGDPVRVAAGRGAALAAGDGAAWVTDPDRMAVLRLGW